MANYTVKNIESVVKGQDVQARVFTLAQGEVIPWHYHEESTDHYFVLKGELTIKTRSPDDDRAIAVGGRYKIAPQVAHEISNRSGDECQFLLVQGVGKYDWNKGEPRG